MHKTKERVGMFALALVLLLVVQVFSLKVSAQAMAEDEVTPEEITEVEISEEEQQLDLVQDKEYLFSYIVEGEGWNFHEIKYRLKEFEDWEIYDWELYDEENENEHIVIKLCEENEQGKVSMKTKCKTNEIASIWVTLANELTGETLEYKPVTNIVDQETPTPTPAPPVYEPTDPPAPTVTPEPTATPEPEKKPIVLTEKNLIINDDGSFTFRLTEDDLPEGAVVKYKVNGVEVDDNYSLSGAGAYVITATFTVPDTNEEKEAKGLYTVKNETAPQFKVEAEQAETGEGQVGFTVSLTDIHTNQGLGMLQFDVEYDKDVMTFDVANPNSPDWHFANVSDYDKGMAMSDKSFLNTNTEVATYIFNLEDPNAKDIVVNLKDNKGYDGRYNSYQTDDVSIILNPSVDVCEITLPAVTNGISLLGDIATKSLPTETKEDDETEEDSQEDVPAEVDEISDDTDTEQQVEETPSTDKQGTDTDIQQDAEETIAPSQPEPEPVETVEQTQNDEPQIGG